MDLGAALIPLHKRNRGFDINGVSAGLYNAAVLFQLFEIEPIRATEKVELEAVIIKNCNDKDKSPCCYQYGDFQI